jgi:DNA replication protein DnaC
MQQASSIARAAHLQLVKPGVEVMEPVGYDPKVCPTCKTPLSDDAHGWTKLYGDHRNHAGHLERYGYCLVPCRTCSGPVEHLREAQRKAATVARLFGASQIPFYAKKWTFDSFPAEGDRKSLAQVQTFVRNVLDDDAEKRGLWLYGAAGRCKTSLAISALKTLMQRERSTLFVQTIELMNKLRASLGKDAELSQDELLRAVTETDVVVLDDVATERPTPYVLEQFYYIVEKRRSAGLWTIFTSNLGTKDLENYWRPADCKPGDFYPGLRVVERIKEYCSGIAVSGRNQRN